MKRFGFSVFVLIALSAAGNADEEAKLTVDVQGEMPILLRCELHAKSCGLPDPQARVASPEL